MPNYKVRETVNLTLGGVLYSGGDLVTLAPGRARGLAGSLVQDDAGNPVVFGDEEKAPDAPKKDKMRRRRGSVRK